MCAVGELRALDLLVLGERSVAGTEVLEDESVPIGEKACVTTGNAREIGAVQDEVALLAAA
jgi:hypothetical protein